jgi:hypothetical protein
MRLSTTRNRSLLLAALLGLPACKAYDASLLDAPRHSAAIEADDCDSIGPLDEPERCNGKDDDCDGVVDENAALDCARAHARGSCVFGVCEIDRCDEGFGDCNRGLSDGCEQALARCGDCSGKCTAARESEHMITTVQTAAGAQAGGAGGEFSDDGELDAGPHPPTGPTKAPTRACEARGDCDAVDACAAKAPTAQGADCDRCACEACDRELRGCRGTTDEMWNSLCDAMLQCFGANIHSGACSGDCLGPCGDELAASFAKGFVCSTDNVVAPCGALRVVRADCYQAKCADVCKG